MEEGTTEGTKDRRNNDLVVFCRVFYSPRPPQHRALHLTFIFYTGSRRDDGR